MLSTIKKNSLNMLSFFNPFKKWDPRHEQREKKVQENKMQYETLKQEYRNKTREELISLLERNSDYVAKRVLEEMDQKPSSKTPKAETKPAVITEAALPKPAARVEPVKVQTQSTVPNTHYQPTHTTPTPNVMTTTPTPKAKPKTDAALAKEFYQEYAGNRDVIFYAWDHGFEAARKWDQECKANMAALNQRIKESDDINEKMQILKEMGF